MAQILTQRALVTALTETTFNEENAPSASTDALLVAEPDPNVDITTIERNFARTSISPLPIAAGRKIQTFEFQHEVRGNGSDNIASTAPRVGRLIEACGFTESQIAANGTTTNGRTDVTAVTEAVAVTWASAGTNSVIRQGNYHIRTTVGGASATAEMRVTGGICPDDEQTDSSQEENAVFTETFAFEQISTVSATGAAVIDDATDPQSVTYDFTGLSSLTIGDTFRAYVLGIPFVVTVTVATPTGLGDDFETAVDAHPAFNASNAAGTVTVTFAGDAASTVITSGATALALGASGHTVTPTWTGSLVLNDNWDAVTKPIGWEYTPISDGFDSLTVYMYLGGVLHKLTGARGTFTVEGTGGELANFTFTFTGSYVAVTDVAIPAATFEDTIPVQVDQALVHVNPDVDLTKALFDAQATTTSSDSWANQINGNFKDLCAASFSIDMGINVVPRQCINETDAFAGAVITGRSPTGSFDPELELVADHDFWGILSTADVLGWRVQVGTERGNVVRFETEAAQYAGLSYADRDGLRTLEVDLRFSATAPSFADDEILIAFN